MHFSFRTFSISNVPNALSNEIRAGGARRLLDFNSKFLRDIQSWRVDLVPVDMQSRKSDLAQVEAAPTPQLLPSAQQPREQPEHPKLERALGIAANVATQLYLTNACPQLRGKALLWWTAGDQQTWQACVSNGFFIGPLYIYTGPRR
jgi:hypothetical protein